MAPLELQIVIRIAGVCCNIWHGTCAGTDSIAKAITQPSLPASDALPQPSPSPDPTAAVKPDTDADTDDRLASHASAGPSGPASQQPAAMQWVETDDLGDSKRQVPAISRPFMPNGALSQLQSGLQHPQGTSQQLLGSSQQPQGSLQLLPGSSEQPQGNLHQQSGNLQQPHGSNLTAQAALQQPQGRYGMTQSFSEQPRADAEPAGGFTQQSGVDVKQEIMNNTEVEMQDAANFVLRPYRECFYSCMHPALSAPLQHPRVCCCKS